VRLWFIGHDGAMEIYDVMRTTFAARNYTDDPVPDEVLYRILDHARFAPSGGNRQGGHVIIVRDRDTKQRLGELCIPALSLYSAQRKAGESPWQTIHPTSVNVEEAMAGETNAIPMFNKMGDTPVVLIVCVDLSVVASMDSRLDRIGVISGASIYPMAWNILLGARNEGSGGALTTLIASAEPAVQDLLNIPSHFAVAGLIPMGKPVKQLTKLSRKPVESFVTNGTFDGPALEA